LGASPPWRRKCEAKPHRTQAGGRDGNRDEGAAALDRGSGLGARARTRASRATPRPAASRSIRAARRYSLALRGCSLAERGPPRAGGPPSLTAETIRALRPGIFLLLSFSADHPSGLSARSSLPGDALAAPRATAAGMRLAPLAFAEPGAGSTRARSARPVGRWETPSGMRRSGARGVPRCSCPIRQRSRAGRPADAGGRRRPAGAGTERRTGRGRKAARLAAPCELVGGLVDGVERSSVSPTVLGLRLRGHLTLWVPDIPDAGRVCLDGGAS